MEIRFSKYNAPFTELPSPCIHYISLDDQRDIKLGKYNAHVRQYRLHSRSNVIEVFDPVSQTTVVHDLSGQRYVAPFASDPVVFLTDDEVEFLQELSQDFGIKAASKQLADYWGGADE